MPRSIGVVGTFIRDTIVTLDNRTVESIGGLYHTLAYLAGLATAGTALYPLCHLGRDFHDTVWHALQAFGAEIRFDLVQTVAQHNTAVTLIYRSAEARDEITTAPMPPVTAAQMHSLFELDAVLINLVTGQDLELAAAQAFKQNSPRTLVYLDFHSLALGIDARGRRFCRRPVDWQCWLRSADVLQLNEKEAATLAGWEAAPQDDDFIRFGKQIVGEYVTACHLTLGSRGSLLFFRRGGEIVCQHLPPAAGLQAVDIIGCGDAFGAAFLTRFLQNGDYVEATRFANRIAGLNSTFMGSLTPEKFKEYIVSFF